MGHGSVRQIVGNQAVEGCAPHTELAKRRRASRRARVGAWVEEERGRNRIVGARQGQCLNEEFPVHFLNLTYQFSERRQRVAAHRGTP